MTTSSIQRIIKVLLIENKKNTSIGWRVNDANRSSRAGKIQGVWLRVLALSRAAAATTADA